jgi:hypothetical protein
MSVVAHKNSFDPSTWVDFIKSYPNQIAPVRRNRYYEDSKEARIELGWKPWSFYAVDVDISTTPIWKVLTPITIHNLFLSGADKSKLKDFATTLSTFYKVSYMWEEIPVVLALEITTALGFPNWLLSLGFIERIDRKPLITDIIVGYCPREVFVINIKLNDGTIWNLFEIEKDGTGFYRYDGIGPSSGIVTEDGGKIKEIKSDQRIELAK